MTKTSVASYTSGDRGTTAVNVFAISRHLRLPAEKFARGWQSRPTDESFQDWILMVNTPRVHPYPRQMFKTHCLDILIDLEPKTSVDPPCHPWD